MINHRFPLDELNPEVQTWFQLIDQARRNPEGKLIPSFLELIYQIKIELEEFFKRKLELRDIKSIFVGISVISYLNEIYAIEKIITFAKDRYFVSLPSLPELISQLSERFLHHLGKFNVDFRFKTIGQVLLFILQKNLQAAWDACIPMNQNFKDDFANSNLSLLESICYALIKNDILPILINNLNAYQTEFARNPRAIYFSLLKNIISKIQEAQFHRRSALQGLKNFLDNLSQIDRR